MTDLEISSHAEGIFKYLRDTPNAQPIDSLAIIGTIALIIFDCAMAQGTSIETFAEDFKQSLIDSYKRRSAKGPERMQ